MHVCICECVLGFIYFVGVKCVATCYAQHFAHEYICAFALQHTTSNICKWPGLMCCAASVRPWNLTYRLKSTTHSQVYYIPHMIDLGKKNYCRLWRRWRHNKQQVIACLEQAVWQRLCEATIGKKFLCKGTKYSILVCISTKFEKNCRVFRF